MKSVVKPHPRVVQGRSDLIVHSPGPSGLAAHGQKKCAARTPTNMPAKKIEMGHRAPNSAIAMALKYLRLNTNPSTTPTHPGRRPPA